MFQKMMLYQLYLPLNGNDGRPLSQSRLCWAQDEIVRFAGGCTMLPASNGLWIAGDGQVYHDLVVPILIVAPDDDSTEWFFCRLAGELAALLVQQEIFIHCTPVSVVVALDLLERPVAEGLLTVGGSSDSADGHVPLFEPPIARNVVGKAHLPGT